MKKSKGFTLIEVMIVIAIIGILAAIAIPNFIKYRENKLTEEKIQEFVTKQKNTKNTDTNDRYADTQETFNEPEPEIKPEPEPEPEIKPHVIIVIGTKYVYAEEVDPDYGGHWVKADKIIKIIGYHNEKIIKNTKSIIIPKENIDYMVVKGEQ